MVVDPVGDACGDLNWSVDEKQQGIQIRESWGRGYSEAMRSGPFPE